MANILITTTPILSEIKILRYIEPLTANVVLGVNFFSDFAASITDMFGGNSETYQGKLDMLTQQVNSLIKDKAIRLGANAVIDYKLQFNEISGKGKQMFMVTATGTACKIAMPNYETVDKIGQATYSQVRRQYLINVYTQRLEKRCSLSDTDWKNIISFQLSELADSLTKEYLRLMADNQPDYNQVQYHDNFANQYEHYLSGVPKPSAATILYQHLPTAPKLIIKLIIDQHLFCPNEIIRLISDQNKNTDIVIRLLQAHKDSYTHQDLKDMKQIIHLLNNLPNKGSYQIVKNGMFSKKEEEMYLCPNGHKNSKDTHFCSNSNCGLNIKGLTQDQVNTITKFERIVEALESVLY